MESKAHAFIHERANAVYINELFRLSNRLRAELGLRYDYYTFDVEDVLPSSSSHQNYSGYQYQSALHPKLNMSYAAGEHWQFFFNTGSGYHTNDARSTVQQSGQYRLPIAVSSELGSIGRIGGVAMLSIAVWNMDMNNELIYVGDEGTTRKGVDMSLRTPMGKHLFVDIDFNVSRGRFVDQFMGKTLKQDYYIPLAPTLTSVGGITAKLSKKLECSMRYRYMHDRPANASNSIFAHGYSVFDATVNYKTSRYKIGLVIENLFNTKWNEAQFATETRMKYEKSPVDELHFTPGTPFYLKMLFGYQF